MGINIADVTNKIHPSSTLAINKATKIMAAMGTNMRSKRRVRFCDKQNKV